MSSNKNCIAMLLAGGQGSRLFALTEKIAKPAVSFGGKYRIIDFTLSNCVNSNIDTVGVLTQYQPLILNDYIGNGQPWDLDRNLGGVHILPPYQAKEGSDWYKGTANAIYQNMHFINRYKPRNVLILSGDHIYKMDYSLMLEYHESKQADCTIAVIKVPMEEAHRFGILSTDGDGRIIEFEEKPQNPKSNNASMGIYIFKKEALEKYLEQDEKKEGSSNDFGKNVIPAILKGGERVFAYTFNGYWKDVGTLESLWQANMDLLGENPAFDIADYGWKIHSRSPNEPPHFMGSEAKVVNSLISSGCEIYGTVINSVISSGVVIAKNSTVKDSVIMANTAVSRNTLIEYSIIDEDVIIGKDVKIGQPRSGGNGITVIGRGREIADGSTIRPQPKA
jgi:glucose-1-phosphate adenylyltransferase